MPLGEISLQFTLFFLLEFRFTHIDTDTHASALYLHATRKTFTLYTARARVVFFFVSLGFKRTL
jgi:hypothetical protein